MKNIFIIAFIISLIIGCAKQKKLSLTQRVEQFQVSECKADCGIDSIGIRTNKTKNGDLQIKLGYIVNCSWKQGYFKSITEQNDTLIIKLDRPHDNGDYPITSCDCFFFFDFLLKDYKKIPKAIRVADLFEKNKYWDEIIPEEILEVEKVIIETD